MITDSDIKRLQDEFVACQDTMTAIGDEVRQHLLLIMLSGDCRGNRVIDIAKKTNLSRPAVSHHIQILKNAGIVKARKEGTCIYYYLDPDGSDIRRMVKLFADIEAIMREVPDRSGE